MKPPFHSGSGPVPYDQFAGRTDYRNNFRDFVQSDESFFWVIEGYRGYGKSSLGSWFSKARFEKKPPMVCYYDLRMHITDLSQISPTIFYNGLIKALIEEASRRSDKIKWRERVKKVLSWISRIGTPYGKLPEIEFKQDGLNSTLKLLRSYRNLLKDKVSSIVIVIDEISRYDSDTDGSVIKQCAALGECLEEFRDDDKPNIGLIILPLPGWSTWLGSKWTPSRYIAQKNTLDRFSAVEVNELLQNIFRGTNLVYNSSFERELRIQSGGHPHLLQSIGFESCQIASSEGEIELKKAHVELAIKKCFTQTNSKIFTSLNGIIESAEINLEGLKDDPACHRLVTAIAMIERTKIGNGLTSDEWYKEIRKVLRNGTSKNDFKKVWDTISISRQIMEVNQGKYRFIGDAIRMYIGKSIS